MKFTTIERLNEMVSATYGAVLQFGDFVFVTDCHWRGGFTAAIYTFDQTASNAGASDVERPLKLVKEADQHFADNGHAIAWCIAHITH